MVGIKSTLKGVKSFLVAPDILGQIIAQIPKAGIGMVSTELGNKLINCLVGIIGNILNEKKFKKPILRSLFTNMMVTIGDPTANQLRELKRNVSDLVGGLKAHSYKSAFGAIFEEPHEIVSSIKGALPSMGGKFNLSSLKGKFGRKNISMASDDMIQSITPDAVSVYSSLGKRLTDKDITGY